MRNENDSTLKQTFIVLGFILTFIIGFVVLAVKKGRLNELLISTPVLLGIWWLEYLITKNFTEYLNFFCVVLIFGIPLLIYSLYWIYLFSQEKITSRLSKKYWANKDWWWSLDGWEFEEAVAEVFRLNGFKAEVTKKTGDGGIDILMYKDGLKYIVQCKHYRNEVSVEPLRELNGLRNDFNADILYFVASSGITKAGEEFISNKPYYFVFTLDDIIAMGLRPSKCNREDIIDVECTKENKSLPNF